MYLEATPVGTSSTDHLPPNSKYHSYISNSSSPHTPRSFLSCALSSGRVTAGTDDSKLTIHCSTELPTWFVYLQFAELNFGVFFTLKQTTTAGGITRPLPRTTHCQEIAAGHTPATAALQQPGIELEILRIRANRPAPEFQADATDDRQTTRSSIPRLHWSFRATAGMRIEAK